MEQKVKIEGEENIVVQAGRDVYIGVKPQETKYPMVFPLSPSLHNQTPPEPNFVGRCEMLETITNWYKSGNVKIGALVGWGGVGKSALVRRWFDSLKENGIHPDGVFWWGFYRNPYLDRFLEELLEYLAGGRIDLTEIKSTWQKVEKIKRFITEGEYLIILDGLEEMQKKEQGEEFGKMQHPEFKEILTGIADSNYKGLCLIITRFPMKDIETYSSYKSLEVEELSKEDTRLLFQKIGVSGSPDEIGAVWEEFKGHTLSLVLLVNYLGRGGDIKKAEEIPSFYSDKEAGGRAHRMLLWYDKQLNKNQRQFMKIFSLFRQAIGDSEFEAIFLPRIKMEPFHFKQMVNDLEKRRLITKGENTYTTHPLIKGYFEAVFDEGKKKFCHKAIYEYFGKIAPKKPETLEEMQPLFEQVYHGCSAGLYDEVLYNVYWEKIHRKEEYFIIHKLGAWETSLSLVKVFFPKEDLSKMPIVSKKSDQSWLLNSAGLVLLATGKPKEAEEPFLTGVQMYIGAKNWKNTSACYQNLADLQFRIGELEKGLESTKKALEMAEKAGIDKYSCNSKAYLAWMLHLLGKDKEAEEWFKEADELQVKIDPDSDLLYSLRGVFYADFLVSIQRIDEAFELTKANLEICQRNSWPDNISRCHRLLGAIERIKGNHKEAEAHLQSALEIARKIGMPVLEIEALLEFGRLDLDTKKYEDAIHKAEDVLKLCARTGFKLYEPEAELILAKVYLAQRDPNQAKTFATSAYEKANSMHYCIVETEAANLLATIGDLPREKVGFTERSL